MSNYYYIGMDIYRCQGSVIHQNTFSNDILVFRESHYSKITYNVVSYPKTNYNTPWGFKLEYCTYCEIENNQISNVYKGLYMFQSNNAKIINNTLSDINYRGVYLYNSMSSIVFSGNVIRDCQEEGVYMEAVTSSLITGNEIYHVDKQGIYLKSSTGNQISGNNVHENGDYGIFIDGNSGSNSFGSNEVCYNKLDVYNPSSMSNLGENDTCDPGVNWDCGNECFYLDENDSQCECKDCQDCSAKLIYSSTCKYVKLNTSLSGVSGDCINPSEKYGLHRRIFDCQSLSISGARSGKGIQFTSRYGSSVQNCTISSFKTGVDLSSSPYTTVTDCTFQSNYFNYDYNAIYSSGSTGVTFTNNVLSNNIIFLYNSPSSIIESNVVDGPYDYEYAGLRMDRCQHSRIVGNELRNLYYAMWIYGSGTTNLTVLNNTIENTASLGIRVVFSNGHSPDFASTFRGNDISRCSGNCIECTYCEETVFEENLIYYSSGSGLRLISSGNNNISNNVIVKNNYYGVYFDSGSTANKVSGNELCYNRIDVHQVTADTNLDFGSNQYDYYENWVMDPSSSGCFYYDDSDPDHSSCQCFSCSECTEMLVDEKCRVVKLRNSSLYVKDVECISPTENYGFHHKTFDCAGNSIIPEITDRVGAPFLSGININNRYDFTITNCTIQSYEIGVTVTNSQYIYLMDNEFLGNYYRYVPCGWCAQTGQHWGVRISGTSNVEVAGCSFSNNNLYVYDCPASEIVNNTFSGLSTDVAFENYMSIHLENSENSVVQNNDISNNPYYGIVVASSAAVSLLQNTISDVLQRGINIKYSDNCEFEQNFVTGCGVGIMVEGCTGVTVVDNYFDNTINAQDDSANNNWCSPSGITFDKTRENVVSGLHVFGGNFWSDYSGVDENGDGVGDTNVPYNSSNNIPTGSGDSYPLASFVDYSKLTVISVNGDTNIFDSDDVGSEFVEQINATGGSGQYVWSITLLDGNPGLSLFTNNGTITGVSDNQTSWEFTIRVTDFIYDDNFVEMNFTKYVCDYSSGVSGVDCASFECYGVANDNHSSVCNGRGTCDAPNQCSCAGDDVSGIACEFVLCFGIMSNDSASVCSGNGTCVSPSQCECFSESYVGEECENWKCFEYLANDTNNVCSGSVQGLCVAPDTCHCSSDYYGSQCGSWKCGSFFNNQSDLVCSGNGTCSFPNNCYCPDYEGSNCENWRCGQFLASETNDVCSGNGLCVAPGVCDCPGYSGSDCQNWTCGSILADNPGVCSGNGTCISPNYCYCPDYEGSECQDWKCGDIKWSNSSHVCSGRGDCVSPFVCQNCRDGYEGSECELWKCGDFFSTDSSNVCSGNGTCLSPNVCYCPDYIGLDCENWKCGEFSANSTADVCSKHGNCLSPNQCFCEDGYNGEFCGMWRCFGELYNDTSIVCSGNGECVASENCTCNETYTGEDCSQIVQAEETIADTDAETLVDTDEETVVDTEAETIADTNAETVADTVAETIADTNAETVAETDAETIANTLAETIADTKAETVVDTEAETNAETIAETVVDTEAETNAETNAETIAETNAETIADTNAETVADTLAETVVDTEAETNAETIADTNAETVADTLAETIADTNAETVAETDAETIANTLAETIADTLTETIGDTKAETIAETVAETTGDTNSETTADTEAETIADTNAETVADSDAETLVDTIGETIADTEADTITHKRHKCFKKRKGEEGVCSNNGWCVKNDLCYCKEGTYSKNCNRTVKCSGIPSANSGERKACSYDGEQGVCYPVPKNGNNKKLLQLMMRDLDDEDWEDLENIYGEGNRMFYKYKNPKKWEDLEFDFESQGVCVCEDSISDDVSYRMCGTDMSLSSAVGFHVAEIFYLLFITVILIL